MNKWKRWAEHEIEVIKLKIPSSDVAKILGRSEASVECKRRDMSIPNYNGVYAPETYSQDEKIYRLYKLAKQLGVKLYEHV